MIQVNALSFPREYQVSFGKRLFDIMVSSVALALLSPIFIVIILTMKMVSKGPVFYKSKRVGANYKIFDFYKFRTMEVDADKKLAGMGHLNQYGKNKVAIQVADRCQECVDDDMPCSNLLIKDDIAICEKLYLMQKKEKVGETFVKISNDPRVTGFGKFLRNSSLDELPQLINVFRGEMSIVGNRPLPLYEAEKLTTDIYARRFNAAAGITGLWQVTKRGSKTMSFEDRVLLDVFYAKKGSLTRDFIILLRTIPALFQKENV